MKIGSMTRYQVKEARAISVALERNSSLIPLQLARLIGLEEAYVLQQMHYWMQKGAGKIINGIRWIWNSLNDWLKQFALTEWQLRRVFDRLEHEFGLIKRARLDKHKWNQTTYYTIDYERLKPLLLSICGEPQIDLWDTTNRSVTDHKSYKEAETTTETSSETTTEPAAAILNFEEEESGSDSLTSLPDLIEPTSVEPEVTGLGKSSAAPPEYVENEKLDLVDGAGIALNPQLSRELMNYTLEQVKAAVDHYREVKRSKGERKNPAGWLTDCLRNQWAVGTTTVQDTKYAEAKDWINLAIKQRLIYASISDPKITGCLEGDIYVQGKITQDVLKPWADVAKLHPLVDSL